MMTRPTHYLLRMVVFLAAVVVLTGFLLPVLITAFTNNPLLNTFILAVMLLGIAWNLRQVLRLRPEVTWLETFQTARSRVAGLPTPRLLAPMASMLVARDTATRNSGRFTLSTTAMRSLLDGIASRLDESRELSRYMTGLLIFLGLLGTFWGLLKTVSSISDVISSMTLGSGEVTLMFDQLKAGLARPLAGMGTAFSASMFGLAGALVLGFLDLTAGQAQNRFYNDLEEWLAGQTRLSSGALAEGGEGASVPVYVQALLEQTAENMENLQGVLSRSEDTRTQASHAMISLSERINDFSDTMRGTQQIMLRIAETQAHLTPVIHRLAEGKGGGAGGNSDEIVRAYLRNIEIYLQRLLAEAEQGRAQTTSELRNDIRVLTRPVAATADGRR